MNRNVLIVGASGTLGDKLVSKYTDDNLYLLDIKKPESMPDKAEYLRCDVCDEDSVKEISESLQERQIKIDIFIYTVGTYSPGKVTEISGDVWEKSMNINVNGFYRISHHLLPHMNEGGKIIAVASQFGLVGAYESIAYCAVKAAMINMIRCIALDYSKEKIRANCVCPGFFESPFLAQVEKGTKMKREWMTVTNLLPKSKVNLDDIVNAIMMLGENDSITGQCIVIDGGYTAR
ncbi:SDR family NAD(P)-dependent oxidoreductase [Butyrivibrio sp. YAB3001]|uniref:SDR family NAD(P)-dependent oxidoreductase n=1 Tax=Butyrivibrio sp. YAB3001 TaxID=1520812 RepID=UPI0008F64671|nr:SDR family oxidoreductase [Butyrivibrio sp. YAB3001]SFC12752.1 NAD(P)-dependent dehydrogenase, short-chain alcohol dehydrogenase family [Butyrivibrio sp. YAB3001]